MTDRGEVARTRRWWQIAGPPRPRYRDAEIREALRRRGSGASPAVEPALDALNVEFERATDAHDSINNRAAALPAVVVGINAFSLSGIRLGDFLVVASVAFLATATAALIASLCAFRALMAGRFDFGPDPVRVGQAITRPKEEFQRDLVTSMTFTVQHALDGLAQKGWWFNLALAAGIVSILGAMTLKLLGGSTP
jgi:hypothetical protein